MERTSPKKEAKSVRIKQMEQYILRREFVTMEELCAQFDVSINTARADVARLVEKGSIKKEYGGVVGIRSSALSTFSERIMKNMSAKEAIGRKAASLVEEGDVIFVDAGTTAACMFNDISILPRNLTIVTANLQAINILTETTDLEVFVLPGKLVRRTNAFAGIDTVEYMQKFNFTKAFLGATGVNYEGKLSDSTSVEAEIKRQVLESSAKTYLLADSNKIGKIAMLTYADLSKIDTWICDADVDKPVDALCRTYDVTLVLADRSAE